MFSGQQFAILTMFLRGVQHIVNIEMQQFHSCGLLIESISCDVSNCSPPLSHGEAKRESCGHKFLEDKYYYIWANTAKFLLFSILEDTKLTSKLFLGSLHWDIFFCSFAFVLVYISLMHR